MRRPGHVAGTVNKRIAYRILAGKPKGERPLGKPTRRWMDNIKIDVREIEWGEMELIVLAQIGVNFRVL
jgi:hypothetical protein